MSVFLYFEMLESVIFISKMTIRDFLYFDKQNEKKMFRDSKKRNVIFVLSIILGVISLFLWNSRCTMDNFNKQESLIGTL